MGGKDEIEVKIRVADMAALESQLRAAGFRQETPRTHEINTLYDHPALALRDRGELLRVRRYGDAWTVTHKSKGSGGRHKSRQEIETGVADGERLSAILIALGFTPSFRYEKYRSEWMDGAGKVVLDETPIGNLAEIEGAPDWIDQTAARIGVSPSEYLTDSYAALFFAWKRQTGSPAEEMTFHAVGS